MKFAYGPVLLIAVTLAACSDQPLPQEASLLADGTPSYARTGLTITLDDQCEPTSFNQALGAGTCTRNAGGITFGHFIALLEQTGSVGAWRIAPAMLTVAEGTTLPVLNTGGEEHTFTEVEEFGGGIVDQLNTLSGNTDVAPECMNLTGADFLSPGQSITEDFDEGGETEKYQCCIHPWMRQVIRVR